MPDRKLKKVLVEKMISAAEIARESGLNERTIRSITNGEHDPRLPTRRKVVGALNKLLGLEGKAAFGQEIFD